MKSHPLFIAVPALLLSLTALASGGHGASHGAGPEAIGKPGVAARVTRTVNIDMRDDMRFHASLIHARRGETIRFIVKNSGKVRHEMVLGTEKELKAHDESMKKSPEMAHAAPNMATVAPGKTGEIIWHFTTAGKVGFACLQPGHYDAGMKGLVQVSGGNATHKEIHHAH
ncbi:MAG: blue (type 1) copper domain protein [Polaromonas sp.]|nr:blue (type 1) copper domain protein [Polaromonas sp.]